MRSEEVSLFPRILPSRRSYHRDPAVSIDIKLRPAVISGYRSSVLIRGKRKANLEARRNSRRSHHADEQRMEIRAISALGGARPDRIAVSPAGSGFVVAHGGDHVVVDCARFRKWILKSACLLRGKFSDNSLKGHTAIRLQEPLQITRARVHVCAVLIAGERNAMLLPPGLKLYTHPPPAPP